MQSKKFGKESSKYTESGMSTCHFLCMGDKPLSELEAKAAGGASQCELRRLLVNGGECLGPMVVNGAFFGQ